MTESEFSERLKKNRPKAMAIANSITEDQRDAEDARQDADPKWWRQINLGKSPFCETDPFYFRLVRHSAIDIRRRRIRRERGRVFDVDDEKPSVLDTAADQESRPPLEGIMAREILDKLRQSVSAEAYHCWEQHDHDGRSCAEISLMTGLNVNTVKTHVRRTREELREILKNGF